MEIRYWQGAIQTYTCREFWPLDPRPEDIFIEDIAHALSLLCRFGGHCKEFYSIAQHAVLVSMYCDPKDALWGHSHDDSEGYISDVCSPVKRHKDFEFYKVVESKLMNVICLRFNLPLVQPDSVTRADELVLSAEVRDLMPKPLLASPHWKCQKMDNSCIPTIIPMSPKEAEKAFLDRFYELGGE